MTDSPLTASIVARLALRYASGALMAKGLIDSATGAALATDTLLIGLIEMGLSAAAATAAEWWYWLARKLGWSK